MPPVRFAEAFHRYLVNIREARDQQRHHDHRRHLFTSFLRDAFDVDVAELQLEEHVTALRVRGFIDLLYQFLVFEFKRNLEAERGDGLRELRTYLTAVEQRKPLGVLTDGLQFEVYALEDGALRIVDEENLDPLEDNVDAAYLWFEAYLFSARDIVPTPEDIVRRFGGKSAVFAGARAVLREMFADSETDPAVQVKYSEWDRLLAKVYGVSVGASDLFVRHTYLALLARVIAYVATTRRRPPTGDILGIVDGQAFQRVATNLVEADFFAWVLADPVQPRTRSLLEALAAHLGQYDLTRLGEMDLLQRLYQDLVDPADRHDLGEYYTPDWLAELTLREAGFGTGKSLLDPACGSGTFLFTAIGLLAASGLEPHAVTQWCLQNMVGVDVHPVAVLTSKVNFVLALDRHGDLTSYPGPISIPVYMADSLIGPRRADGSAEVPVSEHESFVITEDMAADPQFDAAVDTMANYAALPDLAQQQMDRGFRNWLDQQGLRQYATYWGPNARLLRTLIREGRDSIWSFILKNAYRPFYLSRRKFDIVAGNPPWLAYRYIRDAGYRTAIRNLVFDYHLLGRQDRQLFTQMEIATVFWVHSQSRFLADGGTIAFVMPRSVITGARQHRGFREQVALSRILDLQYVDVPSERSLKVFGVDSCVLIAGQDARGTAIPAARFRGTLPSKSMSYDRAISRLTREDYEYDRPAEGVASPYLPAVVQGATIVPRGLWFATPTSGGVNPERPRLMTDPLVMERAQDAWTHVHVEGEVEARFLYATLLSNDLVPFGVRRYSLVVLPLYQHSHRARPILLDASAAYLEGFPGLGNWLEQAERAWEAGRGRASNMSLPARLDYQHGLTGQQADVPFWLLYNRSGSHLAACVVNLTDLGTLHPPLPVEGFVADSGTYWLRCASNLECHYLSAVLNARCLTTAIAPHQTRGAFHGARDVHRRPFEVLPIPIPLFDAESPSHQELSALSVQCHSLVAQEDLRLDAKIGGLRQRIRARLADQLAHIDALVSEMLSLP